MTEADPPKHGSAEARSADIRAELGEILRAHYRVDAVLSSKLIYLMLVLAHHPQPTLPPDANEAVRHRRGGWL